MDIDEIEQKQTEEEFKFKLTKIPNLRAAVLEKDNQMVRHYIEKGEDVNQIEMDYHGTEKNTLFNIAIGCDCSTDILKMLIRAGVDINERMYLKTAIERLNVTVRAIETIQLLIESGFNMVIPDSEQFDITYYIYNFMNNIVRHLKQKQLDKNKAIAILSLLMTPDFVLDCKAMQKLVLRMHLYNKDIDNSDELVEFREKYYRLLFARYKNINETDLKTEKTILHMLLEEYYDMPSHHRLLDMILSRHDIDVNLLDYHGKSPIYYACKNDRIKLSILRRLLQMGADANICCGIINYNYHNHYDYAEKETPLLVFVSVFCKLEIVELLCEFGADINKATDKGFTALHVACTKRNVPLLTFLLGKGANVFVADNEGNTLLHMILNENFLIDKKSVRSKIDKSLNTTIISILINKGLDINSTDSKMRTPLNLALYFGASSIIDIQLIKYFLSLGATVDAQDINGNSSLHYAIKWNNLDLINFLIDNGADYSIENNEKISPYTLSLKENKLQIIDMFEKMGASIKLEDEELDIAFMNACIEGNLELAEKMIKTSNIDITYVDGQGQTPLHHVVEKNSTKKDFVKMAKLLIESGVDVNCTDDNGKTALHVAVEKSRKEMVVLLIQNGADANIEDDNGILAINEAISKADNRIKYELFKLLVETTTIEKLNNSGTSPLYTACCKGATECVRLLLEMGVDPNIFTEIGKEPLIASIDGGFFGRNTNQKEVVKMLIDAGADINLKSSYGNQAIHIAARHGSKEIMSLLIKKGADLNALNAERSDQLAPIHIATKNGHSEVFKLLVENGADIDLQTGKGTSCLDIAAKEGKKKMIELISLMKNRTILDIKANQQEN